MKPIFLPLVFAGACAPTEPASTAQDSAPACEEGVEVGECPPDFTLRDRAGEEYTVSEHRGEVVVATFFTGW